MVGVDITEVDGAAARVDALVIADLADGIPPAAGRDFDIVLAADVIEHVAEPGALLAAIRTIVLPSSVLLVPSTPTASGAPTNAGQGTPMPAPNTSIALERQ